MFSVVLCMRAAQSKISREPKSFMGRAILCTAATSKVCEWRTEGGKETHSGKRTSAHARLSKARGTRINPLY